MRIRKFVRGGALSMLEIGVEAARPFAETKSTPPKVPEIDTQELAERAAFIAETDPARAVFASCVMAELNAERITPEKADFYLTHPDER